MSVIQFPRNPRPDELLLLATHLSKMARLVSVAVAKSSDAIMAANTAAELANSVSAMEDVLAEHAAGFAELAEATRHWR